MVAAGIFGTYLLLFTRFGYNVFATGGNKNAAKAVGINTDRVKILAFVVSGIMVGVTSFILVGWFRGVDPQTGNGLELSVIAAVIIGGTGLFGAGKCPRHAGGRADHRHDIERHRPAGRGFLL